MDPSLLTQYGLPMGFTLVLTGAVSFLYKRMSEAHAKELTREQQRGDRLEDELRELNRTVRDQIVPALTETNRITGEATRALGQAAATMALAQGRQP